MDFRIEYLVNSEVEPVPLLGPDRVGLPLSAERSGIRRVVRTRKEGRETMEPGRNPRLGAFKLHR